MYDAACPFDPPVLQRAQGAVRLAVGVRDGATRLLRLRQEGCLKARLPRPGAPPWLDAVLLNTGGGVAAGDTLDVAVEAGEGARLCVAAQAAERFYRALPGSAPARVRVALRVEAGAALEWLPQESILFDGASLDRVLEVELAADARFLGVETLVFGRALMGERLRQAHLRDTIRIRRGGALLLHDAVRLGGDAATLLDRAAVGNGAGAAATLVVAAPDADAALPGLRDALDGVEAECGASASDGLLLLRLVARDGARARAAVVAALAALRGGRAPPRVWMC